jgi:peroxiredoxin/glutaredoxin
MTHPDAHPRFVDRAGQPAPDVTLRVRHNGAWADLRTAELFAGKTVVLFALPGAFTPTCSSSHVPRYQERLPELRAAGVDTVAVLSVNDAFVMDAWQVDQRAPDLLFLPDGNAEFTRAMGMAVDKDELGFGVRSWRYSMVVRDGVIARMFIEPDVPGDPYQVSDADTLLHYLLGEASPAPDVAMITRPGCSHCARAKALLAAAGLAYDEIPATPRRLLATSGRATTPQVFIDGAAIGGADELAAWLRARGSASQGA